MSHHKELAVTIANEIFPVFLERIGNELAQLADTAIFGKEFSLVIWKSPTQWEIDQIVCISEDLPRHEDGEANYLLMLRAGGQITDLYGLPDLNVFGVSVESKLTFGDEEV